MNAEDIARALGGAAKSAAGWIARCPAHEDQHASLSLTERDGRLLWKCHAGCSQRDVSDALTHRGLWQKGKQHDERPRHAPHETPEQAARRLANGALNKGFAFEAIYPYHDANGRVLFHRARFKNHATGEKWIRPMRVNGAGFVIGEPKLPNGKPLYRLPDIARAPADKAVFIVEGENKVDALAKLGILATTSGSATSANGADWVALKDRACLIWPDHDEPGAQYAREVTAKVKAVGGNVAAWIDVAKLGMQPGDDVVDWLAANPDATEQSVFALPLIDVPEGHAEQGAAVQQSAPSGGGDVEPEWTAPHELISKTLSEPYPLDALPGVIGEAVREVVGFVQCPPSLAAMSALAVVSMAGQALADVRRAAQLEGPACLYFLAVADSGERKTTCDGFFARAVREWEQQQADALKPDIAAHEAAVKAWEQKRDGVSSAIRKAAERGDHTAELEQALSTLESQKPRAPRRPRICHMDTTPEALAWNMARPDGWPSASVLSSEAGIVFGGHGMQRESLMRNLALLNTLWERGRVSVDRRTSESFAVSGVRLTIGLAAQPDTVRAFFDDTRGLARGSGFAARFLIAWPDSTQGSRAFKPGPEHWTSLARFHQRIAELLNEAPTINERGELQPVMLDLSSDARATWIKFHDAVEHDLRPSGDMAETRDVASKAADNAARLAALFHLFEHGAVGEISGRHMQAACRIAAWHLYEARRFFGELALPPALSNAVKLDEWLLRHCTKERTASVSTRTIQREGPTPTRERNARAAAIQELVDAGRVRERKEARQRLVQVNPALLKASDGAE